MIYNLFSRKRVLFKHILHVDAIVYLNAPVNEKLIELGAIRESPDLISGSSPHPRPRILSELPY